MDIKALEEKLAFLLDQLQKLETVGRDEITQKRIDSDMGDDYRENEAAKMAMEDHNIWYLRVVHLRREILKIKKEILALKSNTK